MGIHGLQSELGPGQRIALSKLAAEHYEQHKRPFRLAIDTSIWLYQVQSGQGGTNPALRTLYYRVIKLISFNIHPLFVFDGKNRPPLKRNKKITGGGNLDMQYAARQLLDQLAVPWHIAPGEAEAECALLEKEGVVDAVLSDDVDTAMFGAGLWLRSFTSEPKKKSGKNVEADEEPASNSKTKKSKAKRTKPTHVNVYRAEEAKSRGIDREGMILVALMSGGDYLPEGIPGCGPKVACAAAKAGYGRELCALHRHDVDGLNRWKERLQHQVRTNQDKLFSRRNTTFTIPDDFPNREVLGYYTHPCVSAPEKVEKLRNSLKWDREINFPAVRKFTAEYLNWVEISGAKYFIRNLAPSILIRDMQLLARKTFDGPDARAAAEKAVVKAIHSERRHDSTDESLEYRVSFIPIERVPIDVSKEEPDTVVAPADSETDSTEEGEGTKKKRQMKPIDPNAPVKEWVLATFLQEGCPSIVEAYENRKTNAASLLQQKNKSRAAPRRKKSAATDMPHDAIRKYTQPVAEKKGASGFNVPSTQPPAKARSKQPGTMFSHVRVTKGIPRPVAKPAEKDAEVIDLPSSPAPTDTSRLPSSPFHLPEDDDPLPTSPQDILPPLPPKRPATKRKLTRSATDISTGTSRASRVATPATPGKNTLDKWFTIGSTPAQPSRVSRPRHSSLIRDTFPLKDPSPLASTPVQSGRASRPKERDPSPIRDPTPTRTTPRTKTTYLLCTTSPMRPLSQTRETSPLFPSHDLPARSPTTLGSSPFPELTTPPKPTSASTTWESSPFPDLSLSNPTPPLLEANRTTIILSSSPVPETPTAMSALKCPNVSIRRKNLKRCKTMNDAEGEEELTSPKELLGGRGEGRFAERNRGTATATTNAAKKKMIILRESINGMGWREVDIDDKEDEGYERKRKWRKSEVDVVDLTGE
ncbi:hypothetical protein K470DRAFT_254002 [Piedraia hortae CBS 480.64]|uniref:XPG-I domain-containing protein n=1 Tax=Piedraia hortae CBS 480.64 TaxID=1314780 RepID=A0A6A7CAB4_9PEZI|nr:hypothetical protein K470DRAFT_254002 [Piedraia hortae CBS 480.64]